MYWNINIHMLTNLFCLQNFNSYDSYHEKPGDLWNASSHLLLKVCFGQVEQNVHFECMRLASIMMIVDWKGGADKIPLLPLLCASSNFPHNILLCSASSIVCTVQQCNVHCLVCSVLCARQRQKQILCASSTSFTTLVLLFVPRCALHHCNEDHRPSVPTDLFPIFPLSLSLHSIFHPKTTNPRIL